ncbi:MAG: helix-turn-helix transcriptional regulator [Minicystis sp.]
MSLSPREHQIFMLLVEGHAVSDIAAQPDLGVSTVSTHVAHLRSKPGVSTVAGIVAYAYRERVSS